MLAPLFYNCEIGFVLVSIRNRPFPIPFSVEQSSWLLWSTKDSPHLYHSSYLLFEFCAILFWCIIHLLLLYVFAAEIYCWFSLSSAVQHQTHHWQCSISLSQCKICTAFCCVPLHLTFRREFPHHLNKHNLMITLLIFSFSSDVFVWGISSWRVVFNLVSPLGLIHGLLKQLTTLLAPW